MIRKNLREKILEKSTKLFSEFGFLGTPMAEIAKSLDITKAALYYHFKSKRKLYLEVLDRCFQRLLRDLKKSKKAKSLDQKIFQSIKSYLKWAKREKNLVRFQPKIDPEIKKRLAKLKEKIEDQFSEIFKDALKKEINLKLFIFFLLGTMDRIVLEASFLGQGLNVKKRTSQILEILGPILKLG